MNVREIIPAALSTSPFTWTSLFSGGTLLALVYLIIKQVGPWRKITADASDKLIAQLTKRLDRVERQLAIERKMNYIQTARLEARHAAQRALDRHKFVNADSNLESLLRILEVSPDKAPEAAKQALATRAKQRDTEQLEAAEIHKAEILAVEMAEKELADMERREQEDDDDA